MSLYEALIDLLGSPPAGYEPIAYAIAACFAFYFISIMFGFLASLFRGNR